METSPRHQDNQNQQSLHPSPTSYSSSSSNSSSTTTTPTANSVALNNNINHPPPFPSPKSISRSESTNPYPTTFVQADTSSFKHVVQMLTGSPKPATTTTTTPNTSQLDPLPKTHNIPPIKSIPKKNQSSGFKLYERRNSLKNLKLNPLNPIFAQPSPGFSPRKPEILSPSILDFPSLVLSPVTPLIPDPFDRSGPANYTNCFSPINTTTNNNVVNAEAMDTDAEEKAIKEKGFYLHPSPGSTPRETEPRLLPLFPVTSPRIPGSVNPSS